MNLTKLFLIAAFRIACASLMKAQAPPQVTPAKVGAINSQAFSDPTGEITRLVNTLKTIDAEFKPRRDEIAQLVARFNTLQADAARAPTAAKQDQLQTLQIEITRKQEDARAAFAKRTAALTNPIRLSVFNALEAFARQRGIDVLIDLSQVPV